MQSVVLLLLVRFTDEKKKKLEKTPTLTQDKSSKKMRVVYEVCQCLLSGSLSNSTNYTGSLAPSK